MATVKLENVKKIYQGNVVAVHDFNLDIADKEFIVFVGPSGCGKSTTLRMVAGLEEISEGIVRIDDEIVNDLQPKDRYISMVFQNYALYPHLTVFENMAFPLRITKAKKYEPLTEEEITNLQEEVESLAQQVAAEAEAIAPVVEAIEAEKKAFIEENDHATIDQNRRELEAEIKRVSDIVKLLDFTQDELKDLHKSLKKSDSEGEAALIQADIEKREQLLETHADFVDNRKELNKELKSVNKSLKSLDKKIAQYDYAIGSAKVKLNGLKHKLDLDKEMLAKGKITYVKMSAEEIYQRVISAAETLGITPYLARKPKALSGGQRQRVAIGRAMVKDCKVFLMDEPLSNLDAKLRNQMRAEIILLRQKIDTTFIYVTHDQTEAMTLGDRIVVMKDGFIMQVGTPVEVFDHPDNLFVAEFIGAPKMNIMKTNLVKEGDKYFVTPFGSKIEVDGDKGRILAQKGIDSREVILGVRPEHITLSKSGGIKTTLQVNEMMGSELHLHLLTEDGTALVVRVPTIQLTDEERESMVFGKELHLTFEGKVMHLFDVETEETLLKVEK